MTVQYYKLTSKKIILAQRVYYANHFFDRLQGLMFKEEMKGYDGMLIEPCNSIHTFFMKFPIDVVFLGKHNCVKKIIRDLSPWRVTAPVLGATKVLEMASGKLPGKIKIGDKVEIECIN